MDEQRQRDDERVEDARHDTGERPREPMMEAPAAPAGDWHNPHEERSWNPAQGDRSFGYGSDETAASEAIREAQEPVQGSRDTAGGAQQMTRPTDAEAPGE